MLIDQDTWDHPDVVENLKLIPPILRHFNYSMKGDNSYEVVWLSEKASPALRAKTRYIRKMMAEAHGIQIGQLRIYFSQNMPIGLFHPDCGPLCMDNFWDRKTAYHLNQINRQTDKRLSMEHFYGLVNHYMRIEIKRDIKLYIPEVFDYAMRNKMVNYDYVTAQIW